MNVGKQQSIAALDPLALLLVPESCYAHLVIAHCMIILWRSTCTHTAHMYDGKTCNGPCRSGRQLDCVGSVLVDNPIQV